MNTPALLHQREQAHPPERGLQAASVSEEHRREDWTTGFQMVKRPEGRAPGRWRAGTLPAAIEFGDAANANLLPLLPRRDEREKIELPSAAPSPDSMTVGTLPGCAPYVSRAIFFLVLVPGAPRPRNAGGLCGP